MFPYVVLIALAAQITGRPVKWVEDRIEHLVAASSGPNRVTEIEAAITKDGRILGLKLDQLEDYGAFLRAPMPGPLYRMHGAVTGAYDIANVEVTNRVVLTNKMPSSLIRGFGGPQLYLALERLMQRIAVELDLDPLDVIRRNLVPAEKFPYHAAAGALYDSGDYPRAVEKAVGGGRLDALKRRRDEARAAGRKYGIGFAAVVEPGMSNMGYLSTLLTAQAREKAGPKNGAVSMARVNIDPLGAVSVTADVTVQGPEPRDRAGADRRARNLGLEVRRYAKSMLEIDTAKDAMVDRRRHLFLPFRLGHGGGGAHGRGADARQARKPSPPSSSTCCPTTSSSPAARSAAAAIPTTRCRSAASPRTSHWSPVMLPEDMAPALRETGVWSPPELEPPSSDDRINTSLTYGFVFDMCGVEIDPATYAVRVDRYVSMHDAGRILNPMIAEGPDPRRLRPGHRRRALRGVHLQRRGRIPQRHLRRLSGADRERNPRRRDLAYSLAVAVHAARRQGPGRRQLHEHARLHRQRHRRRARRRGRDAAGDAAAHSRHVGRRQTMKPRK